MGIAEVLQSPAWRPLTCTLLHFVWQGAIVALAWCVLFRMFRARTVQFRYLLGLAGMFLMAVCPVATFVFLESASPPHDVRVAVAPAIDAAAPNLREALPVSVPDRIRAPLATDGTEARSWQPYLAERIGDAQPYLLGGWIAGLLLLSGRLLLSVVGISRLKRGRMPLSGGIADRATAIAGRLGLRAAPRLFSSEAAREAIVTGLLRPIVLLPAAWLVEMSPDVLDAVVAHELAHIRRYDLWLNLFQRVVETLLFYHPAVWWLSRRVRLAREMCCDELAAAATGERVVYATALEQAARKRLEPARSLLEVALGVTRMTLLDRVRNVLGLAARHEEGRWWPAAVLAMLTPLAIWLVSMAASTSAEEEKPAAEKKETTDTGPRPPAVSSTARWALERTASDIGPQSRAVSSAGWWASERPANDTGPRPGAGSATVWSTPERSANDTGPRPAAVTVTGTASWASERPAKRRSAAAFLRISMQENAAIDDGAVHTDRDRFEIYKNTQAAILISPVVLRAALKRPEIAKLAIIKEQGGENPERWLADHLNVTFPGKAEIMKIEFTGPDAVVLVNGVVNAYLGEVIQAEEQRKKVRFNELERVRSEREEDVRRKRETLRSMAEGNGGSGSGGLSMAQKLALEELALQRQELAKVLADRRRYEMDLAVQNAYLDDAKGNDRLSILKEIKRLEVSLRVMGEQTERMSKNIKTMTEQAAKFGVTSVGMEMLQMDIKQLDTLSSQLTAEIEKLKVELRSAPRVTLLQRAE
jgi:beta-lactamase regulating signal transducer with metallopeptidase domain